MRTALQEPVRISPAGMISRKSAAAALQVKPKTMCEWASKGLGPRPVRVGGRVFYRWVDVLAFATGDLAPRV